jgi:large subunit ribosomal protein L4
MIQLALRSALSDRASQGRVALIDAWTFEVPSTKAALAALKALGLSGRVLVVLGEEDGYADRSFGNLPEIQTIVAGELNAYDILVNDWVVFTDETLPGGSGEAVGAPDPGATAEVATEASTKADTDTDTDAEGDTGAGAATGSGADLDSPPAVDDTAAGDEEGSGS